MPVSESFLLERKTAIGGSDVLHLVNLPPYGCTRRLWYDKRDIPPDFPQKQNRHMERGSAMEPFAKTKYALETGREIREVPWKLDASLPYIGCHADGLINCPTPERHGGLGLLEIKCPTARYYYSVRSKVDPPNEANLQAQWGMMTHGLRWGSILLFSADAWQMRYWDVEGDDQMQSDLRTLGVEFWKTLKRTADNPHERLDPNDSRCRSCPWRKTCQGLDEGGEEDQSETLAAAAHKAGELVMCNEAEADQTMAHFLAAQAARKGAQEAYEIAKAQLMGMFPHPGRIVCGVGEARLSVVRKKPYTAEYKETTYPLLRVIAKVEEFADDGDVEDY